MLYAFHYGQEGNPMKTLAILNILIYLTLTACTTPIANTPPPETEKSNAPSCVAKPLLRQWRTKLPSEYSGQIEYLDFSEVEMYETFLVEVDADATFGTLQGFLKGNETSGEYNLINTSVVDEGGSKPSTYEVTMKTTYDISCDTLTVCYKGWYVNTDSPDPVIQNYTKNGTQRMPDNFDQVKFILDQVDGLGDLESLTELFGYFGESFTTECIEFQ
jgi:hypothetical protein